MDAPHLIYFADPMCSWCWGFAPTAEAAAERLPLRLVLGGLRPGTTTPMTREARAEMPKHWEHVREASGQPFNGEAFVKRDGFVYDTDPAARAVVAARRQDPAAAMTYLRAAQSAFYAEGRDVTQTPVLEEIAADLGLDQARFAEDLASEDVKNETWGDYATSQNAGVRGFPTLIVGRNPDGTYAMVTRGFQARETVLASIDAWLAAR
jgi:putative protein-disulfide isomerase